MGEWWCRMIDLNYAKFSDLLAEAKAVCGTKDDE